MKIYIYVSSQPIQLNCIPIICYTCVNTQNFFVYDKVILLKAVTNFEIKKVNSGTIKMLNNLKNIRMVPIRKINTPMASDKGLLNSAVIYHVNGIPRTLS